MTARAIVLPTGHGKTTLHNPDVGVFDAAAMVEYPHVLREMRKDARETGNWGKIDSWWSDRVRGGLKDNCKLVLVPSNKFAEQCDLLVIMTIILPETVIENVVRARPKSGLANALANRREEEENGHNVVHVLRHEDVAMLITIMLSDMSPDERLSRLVRTDDE
jgi:hypothetical protein